MASPLYVRSDIAAGAVAHAGSSTEAYDSVETATQITSQNGDLESSICEPEDPGVAQDHDFVISCLFRGGRLRDTQLRKSQARVRGPLLQPNCNPTQRNRAPQPDTD